jgi:signal peptidase II
MNPTGSDLGRQRLRIVVAAGAVVAIDLLSKAASSAYLTAEGIDLPGPLDLRLAYNTGMAFSLGNNAPTWLVALTGGVAVTRHRGGVFASSAPASSSAGASTSRPSRRAL